MSDQRSATPDLVWAKYLVLVAATLGLMYGEFHFAIKTGNPWQVAWTYPAALDIYAYAAFRSGHRRDVATALIMMAASQAGAHLPIPHDNPLLMIAPWAVAMPIVLWRVHFLSTSNPGARIAVDVDDDAPSAGEPEPKEDAVIPLPSQRRWTFPEAAAAITHYRNQGLTSRKAIAPLMGISPQMVGQHMARMAQMELVAA